MSNEMANKEVKQQIEVVHQHLAHVPENMRIFSTSMRSLYAEFAVGTSSSTAQRFRELRDDTRTNAVVYVKCVLPVVKQCVSDIKSYFEYYQDLTMDEWWESIDYIAEETKAHEEACDALIAIHDDVIDMLKMREDDTKIIIHEMPHSRAENERISEQPEALSFVDNCIAVICYPVNRCLAFFSYCLTFFSYCLTFFSYYLNVMFGSYEPVDLVKDVGRRKETEIQIVAAEIVQKKLIPSLGKSMDGLKGISCFFKVINRELVTLQTKGSNGRDTEELKRVHYSTMRGKAGQMIKGCNGFFAVLPSIRSDLEAIPTEGTDKNYVDRWMESQQQIIRNKCSQMDSVKKLLNATNSGRN